MFSVWSSVDQASESSSVMGFKNYFSQFIFQIVFDFFRFFSSLFFLNFRMIATVSGLTINGTYTHRLFALKIDVVLDLERFR